MGDQLLSCKSDLKLLVCHTRVATRYDCCCDVGDCSAATGGRWTRCSTTTATRCSSTACRSSPASPRRSRRTSTATCCPRLARGETAGRPSSPSNSTAGATTTGSRLVTSGTLASRLIHQVESSGYSFEADTCTCTCNVHIHVHVHVHVVATYVYMHMYMYVSSCIYSTCPILRLHQHRNLAEHISSHQIVVIGSDRAN